MKKVLITGIAGGQGRLVARKLLARREHYRVHGVDRVAWKGRPARVALSIADVRKKKFEDVIRRERPDAIVHLAAIRHFSTHPAVRHEVNVNGTKRLIEFAVSHGVENVVICSSSYVYGALPENPYYMDESFPLSVSRTYPEVRDLSEMDMLASAYLWEFPETAIAVLRPVNVLGYHVHSAIGRYLRSDDVPTLLGFDPMMQFIHEDDLAEVIVLAIETQHARGFQRRRPRCRPAARRHQGDRRPRPAPTGDPPEGRDPPAVSLGALSLPLGGHGFHQVPVHLGRRALAGSDGIRAPLLPGGDLRRGEGLRRGREA